MKNKPESFPLLTEFARGYLHQDMVAEYGDAYGAAKAYAADLSEPERKALAAEARKIITEARGWNPEELNQQLRGMGAACSFASPEEYIALLRTFEHSR